MKTQERNFLTVQSNNQSLQWERKSLVSLFSWLWLWAPGLCTLVKTSRWSRAFARALKEVRVGLHVLSLTTLSNLNVRIFVGLGVMGVVAPLSACFYMLFDRVDYVQDWYHVNYFHLFFLLGPHLFILSGVVGAWFLFPQGSKRAYALVVPAGYTIAKILWLIQCSSNEDFWSVVPLSFILTGVLISAFLFISLDWLAHNKFHREDAYQARMDNLVKLADEFDDVKFKSMVKTVWREKEAFQKQY
jgi:hypothetical protein